MHLVSPHNSDEWKGIIDATVPMYCDAIKVNVEKFNNLHTIVFNVIPPTREEDLVLWGYQHIPCSNNLKKDVHTYMNAKLKEYCEKYNYIFFDVYDKYCDEDGFLSKKFNGTEGTHIINPIYYIEFLNNLKIFGN
jgi:hypothetical protein